jgi:hypothetical protein
MVFDITTIQAQNPQDNISIQSALKFNAYLQAIGLALTNIYATQENAQGPAGGYTLSQLAQLGVDPTVPIYLMGQYTQIAGNAVGETKSIEIGPTPALIEGAGGLTSYMRLFALLNSGSTAADAENALLNNTALSTPLLAQLTWLKSANGIA